MNIAVHEPQKNTLNIYTTNGTLKTKTTNRTVLDKINEEDIILIEEVSEISKTQLEEWLSLSSWFDEFKRVSISDVIDKTILFYDSETQTIKVCDLNKGIYSIEFNKESIEHLADSSFGYVESAHLMTKKQFSDWLCGIYIPEPKKKNEEYPTQKPNKQDLYLHTVDDRTVLIEDIQIEGYPLKLSGRYHFVPVNSIGWDVINSSEYYKILMSRKKIELVGEEYVQANKHKFKKSSSLNTTLPVGNVDDFMEKDENTIYIE